MENNNNIINEENAKNYSIFIKVIYGIIGGIQSILNIISGFCDAFYLLKEFKIFILENLFKVIKYCVLFFRNILTFKFINNKNIRLIANLIISFGISFSLILLMTIKKEKENALIQEQTSTKSKINLFLNSLD